MRILTRRHNVPRHPMLVLTNYCNVLLMTPAFIPDGRHHRHCCHMTMIPMCFRNLRAHRAPANMLCYSLPVFRILVPLQTLLRRRKLTRRKVRAIGRLVLSCIQMWMSCSPTKTALLNYHLNTQITEYLSFNPLKLVSYSHSMTSTPTTFSPCIFAYRFSLGSYNIRSKNLPGRISRLTRELYLFSACFSGLFPLLK
jgi:hypothetical protein